MTDEKVTVTVTGCSPVFAQVLAYAGALFIFIIAFVLEVPDLPFPIVGNLFPDFMDDNPIFEHVRYLALAFWCIHFIRRTFEVVFVHIYNRRQTIVETVGVVVYYCVFALLNSWVLDKNVYKATTLPFIIIGIILFIIGEIGNCWCHYQLRCFRTHKYTDSEVLSLQTGRVIPHGGPFNLLTCPHYFFEVVTWLGFFLVTLTLWSVIFLLCTIVTLVIYGYKKNVAYKLQFDGKDGRPLYPKKKILLPYIF